MKRRRPTKQERASERLDKAAVAFAATQLLLKLSYDDDGLAESAGRAWRELGRAARAFTNAGRLKKR